MGAAALTSVRGQVFKSLEFALQTMGATVGSAAEAAPRSSGNPRPDPPSLEGKREALDVLLRSSSFDAILMDIMMPDLDGYQAIETIRNIARFADLPIIALTAKAMKGDRETALAAGATDYIAKPAEIPDLMDKIRATIYR